MGGAPMPTYMGMFMLMAQGAWLILKKKKSPKLIAFRTTSVNLGHQKTTPCLPTWELPTKKRYIPSQKSNGVHYLVESSRSSMSDTEAAPWQTYGGLESVK